MESRRDGLDILRYTYIVVLVYAYITGINTTACTDRTGADNFNHVIRMCEGGTLVTPRVVIDTWGSGGPGRYSCTCTVTLGTESEPTTTTVVVFMRTCASSTVINTRVVIDTWGTGNTDVYSCSCTVTLSTASEATTTTVVVQEYPRVVPLQNCRSILTITSTKSSSHTKTGCTRIAATHTDEFGTSDKLTLTLSRAEVSTSWISGHCILLSSDGSTSDNLIVTCKDAQRVTYQSTTTTAATTTPTTEYVPTTPTTEYVPTTTVLPLTTTATTKSIETTTSSRETTTITQSRELTMYHDTTTGQTTSGQEKWIQECLPQKGYSLSAVVAPLVVTMVITVVSMAANVILYRRLALVKQPENTEAAMTSSNPVHYDSLDLSRVEPPNLYADTTTGQTYVNTAMQ